MNKKGGKLKMLARFSYVDFTNGESHVTDEIGVFFDMDYCHSFSCALLTVGMDDNQYCLPMSYEQYKAFLWEIEGKLGPEGINLIKLEGLWWDYDEYEYLQSLKDAMAKFYDGADAHVRSQMDLYQWR